MKNLILFTIGLAIGGTVGGLSGNWHGIAVTLQAQNAPEPVSVEYASAERGSSALPSVEHLVNRTRGLQ